MKMMVGVFIRMTLSPSATTKCAEASWGHLHPPGAFSWLGEVGA